MNDTIQLGEMHGEHHGTYKLGRWDWITRGYTPAGVEAWNAIRAIDYLETLPSINKNRIGITGRSGGGAYSWFTAALDPRIAVAVPVAGITDLRNHIVDNCVEGHCDCMYFINYFGWDYNRLAALVAPRALMLANSDHDTIFPLDGVMRIHNDVASLYARLGAANKFGLLLTPGPHLDTQELQSGRFSLAVDSFNRSSVTVDRAALKELQPTELQVFKQETPRDPHVADVSAWFVAEHARATKDVPGRSTTEPWPTEPWHVQLRDAIHEYDTSKVVRVGSVTCRWLQQKPADDQTWLSQVVMLQSGESFPRAIRCDPPGCAQPDCHRCPVHRERIETGWPVEQIDGCRPGCGPCRSIAAQSAVVVRGVVGSRPHTHRTPLLLVGAIDRNCWHSKTCSRS